MNETYGPEETRAECEGGTVWLGPSKQNMAGVRDRARRQYAVTIMRPGRVVQADGQPSNWFIPAETILQAAPLFDGVACYLDHPELMDLGYRGEPQVKNLVGVILDPEWDEATQALAATLRLYDRDPNSPGALVGALFDQMLADRAQGLDVPPVGLSAVFFHASAMDEEAGLRVTTEFRKIESVDIVYSAGAGGCLRQALAAQPNSERSRTMTQETLTQTAPPDEQREAPVTDAGAPSTGHPGARAPSLEQLSAQVQALTELLATREADDTISGLAHAPRDRQALGPAGRFSLGPSGLDQIQAAWDWIFGAESATPPPDLRRTDRLYYLLTGDGEWTGMFSGRDALAAANATTLPGMVVNAMNKAIVPLYNRLDQYRWYEQIVSVQPTDGTLHDMAWIQFGGVGDLPVVAEGAAYTELAVSDSKESDSFSKYGGYVGISEKALRNSDIATIQAIPRALTVAAVQTRSAKIASLFTASSGVGPTLDQDAKALFHADHGNLATTAFSISAWQAARLECYKQTELGSGKRQGLWPRFWLGPADLYDTALITFGYGAGPGGYTGTANNDVNPYAAGRAGDPRPVPIAVPDMTDANDWAYIADPLVAPVIQMAYADSPGGGMHPAPSLYMVTSPTAGLMFTNDVLPIKVRDYFAYGVATYRGIGKRNVA